MKHVAQTIFVLLLLAGCKQARDKMNEDLKPTARGEVSEIILVIDSAQWQGEIGEQLKEMYNSPMPGLPQPEPAFDLKKVNPLKINSVFKSAANMIFLMTLDSDTQQSSRIRDYFTNSSLKMISNDSSLFMAVHRDEFARGQLVLYLFSQSEELLLEKLKENQNQLVSLFENSAIKATSNKLFKKTEKSLMASLEEDYGFNITIPFGWDLAKKRENFVWFRKLEADAEQDVFIYSQPYNDQSIFDDIAAFRDEITEQYLRDSEKNDLYITRQEQDYVPFVTQQINFNSSYAVQARGLWKISDNSGGGPFISYTIVDEEQQKIYYIEGYVYSPGTDKKNLVREVNAILTTFKIPSKVD